MVFADLCDQGLSVCMTCVIRARVSVWLVWSGLEYLYDLCDQGLSVCMTCVIRAWVSVWLVWSGLEYLYDLCDQGLSVCMTCVIRAWVSVWLVWSGLECLYDLCDQGLSILLNTCNLRTADRYTEFADHVTCVSLKCEEAVPVVNRRLVYLYVSLSMFAVSLH